MIKHNFLVSKNREYHQVYQDSVSQLRFESASGAAGSGHDRSDRHLGGYLWERFGREVRRPHAGFHRAERMFDCFLPLPHGMRILVEALCASSSMCSCSQRVIRRSLPVVQLALSAGFAHLYRIISSKV
jgi:hypothetical protein